MEGNGGALGSGERFNRIEATLLRIEAKLDRKADISRVEQIGAQLMDLTLHGSSHAQEAAKLVLANTARLETLERDALAQAAVVRALGDKQSRRLRAWEVLIATAALLAVVISSAVAVINLAHG